MADVSKTLQSTSKQSRWMNSTTGDREHMCFDYGMNCPFNLFPLFPAGSKKKGLFFNRRSCPAPERLTPPAVDNHYSLILADCISRLDLDDTAGKKGSRRSPHGQILSVKSGVWMFVTLFDVISLSLFWSQVTTVQGTAWCAWENRPESPCLVATGVCAATARPESSSSLAAARCVDTRSRLHQQRGVVTLGSSKHLSDSNR